MRRLLLLFAVAAGCTLLTPFDPEGLPCDASAPPAFRCLLDGGYVCVPSELFDAGVCMRGDAGIITDGGARDAGSVDAGRMDSGVADAGRSDSGVVDSGTLDSGTFDAGSSDAGFCDAGTGDGGC
ncbi:MAG: hypothetical protein JNG84_00660 [Archangium sp.]|nr:hypothetical protein [Archangium sp.]